MYKKYMFLSYFYRKKGSKNFIYIQFCRARRTLSNHVKKSKKKKIYSIFELLAPCLIKALSNLVHMNIKCEHASIIDKKSARLLES